MDERKFLQNLTKKMRVGGMVCGRSIKTDKGEIFISFQAEYPSSEPGISSADIHGDNLLSVKEARVAAYLLGLQTDIAAHEHALASGLISSQFCQDTISSLKTRYSNLINNELQGNHEQQ